MVEPFLITILCISAISLVANCAPPAYRWLRSSWRDYWYPSHLIRANSLELTYELARLVHEQSGHMNHTETLTLQYAGQSPENFYIPQSGSYVTLRHNNQNIWVYSEFGFNGEFIGFKIRSRNVARNRAFRTYLQTTAQTRGERARRQAAAAFAAQRQAASLQARVNTIRDSSVNTIHSSSQHRTGVAQAVAAI